jgi:tetratricopeptide (TPR) repeat protein
MVVKSLESSQPLAFKILTLTTIACLHESCTWTGCYSEFNSHRHAHCKKDAESRLKNTSISKTNSHTFKKERYESQSPFGHEAKYSEKSTHEEVLKIRKLRSYSIDSTHMIKFDSSFLAETQQSFSRANEASLFSKEFSPKFDEKDNAETSTMNFHHSHELFARADKLKKQANAKFNGGCYLDARALYTEGINMVKEVTTMTQDDLKLLSDMYSNRASTFYRYKKFDECVNDCEDAIRYDPTLEKAWLRKWRALMVKGAFHNAHAFLEDAVSALPHSNRIRDEYDRSVKEMGVIHLLMQSMETGEHIDADKLRYESFDLGHSENVLLLKCSAEVMISKGDANGALKYIDRALEINPTHEECLELQGICHFYNGNMKEAVQVLSESCRENDSAKLKKALARVHNCYALHTKAKVQTHHGRHDAADELLATLIRACEPLPSQSMLFSMLRVDRAHNSLQMQKYLDVLQDCQEVIDVNAEFVPVWIIRSDVLLAQGKSDEARKELVRIRKTWGAGDSAIESKYRKVDFEFRVSRANDDVAVLQKSLESGTCDTLPTISFFDPLGRKTSHSKRVKRSEIIPHHPMERRNSLPKKEKQCDETPSESFHKASITSGKSTESLDRWTSHSKREKSGDEIPAKVNRTESLSQSSNHVSRNKSNEPLGAAVSSSKRVLLRKSSLNEKLLNSSISALDRQTKHDAANETMGSRVQLRRASLSATPSDCTTAMKTSKRVLVRKSSLNEKLTRSAAILDMHSRDDVPDESMGRRVHLRRPSLSSKASESSPTLDKQPRQELGDDKGKPNRLRRSNSIIEREAQKTTTNPRKPPERHKSSDNVLCQASNDKLAEFRQQQRMKTLNGIFGSDWKNDSSRSINANPADLIDRPEVRRSKSDDLMELRQALSDVYSGKAKH